MKTVTMIVCAVLSLSVGIGAASPLLVNELTLKPYYPLPKGPSADFDVNVVYAEFLLTPFDSNAKLPSWYRPTGTGYNLTFNVVLNVTNDCDRWAEINSFGFMAAKNLTTNVFFGNHGWFTYGATMDGVWYNVTLMTGNIQFPQFDDSGKIISTNAFTPVSGFEPYLQEGVFVYEQIRNGSVTASYLNMNGTWVDVSGRLVS